MALCQYIIFHLMYIRFKKQNLVVNVSITLRPTNESMSKSLLLLKVHDAEEETSRPLFGFFTPTSMIIIS